MDYHFGDYRPGNLKKLEVLVGGDPDALAIIVHKMMLTIKARKWSQN
jgi:GTP-binding protein LepA